MRWLSLFITLIYLNLLCAPQAVAVQDMRIASLSDKQLQALTPSIQPHTVAVSQDSDDAPPALLAATPPTLLIQATSQAYCDIQVTVACVRSRLPGARAPPVFLTVI